MANISKIHEFAIILLSLNTHSTFKLYNTDISLDISPDNIFSFKYL